MAIKEALAKVRITADAAADYYRIKNGRLPKEEMREELEYYIDNFNGIERYRTPGGALALNYDGEMMVFLLPGRAANVWSLAGAATVIEYMEAEIDGLIRNAQ